MLASAGRRCAALAALFLVCAGALPTSGYADDRAPRPMLAQTARAFDEAALRVNDSQPADLVRWSQPIFLAVVGGGAMTAISGDVETAVRTLADIVGIAVTRVAADDPRRNFLVRQADPAGRAACRTAVSSRAGHIVDVEIEIYFGRSGTLMRCINHEAMHAFGFRSHPQAAPSILSYRERGMAQPSATDRLLLQTLYDARLQPGMKVGAASQAACGVIADRLGVSPQESLDVCGAPAPADRRLTAFGPRIPARNLQNSH